MRRAWPAIIVGLLAIGAAALLAHACRDHDDVAFLVDHKPARWILYPSPAVLTPRPAVPMDTVFRRSLALPKEGRAEAWLHVRAFRSAAIRVNGRRVPLTLTGADWKREQSIEITQFLWPRENTIDVTVTNDKGPPALWLAVTRDKETLLVSDASWEASLAGASWQPAVLAREPRPFTGFDRFRLGERVSDSCLKTWPWWILVGCTSLAILVVDRWRLNRKEGRNFNPEKYERWLIRLLLILICLLWSALFVHNAGLLDGSHGFDASGHLDYINYIQTQGTLPLADNGWEMYHPPLYYLLAATVLAAAGRTVENGLPLIRMLNLALALANVFTILACLRLVFPNQLRRQVLGLLIAAFLPMSLYLFHYPTNEVLSAALSTVAIYCVLRILCNPDAGSMDYLLAGFALGAGALAKATGLLLLPIAAAAIGTHLWIHRTRYGWPQAAGRLTLLIVIALSVCSWHYVRVWRHFGSPLANNWDTRDDRRWWQDPGYHTLAEYGRFGQSLRSPAFCVWNGTWDGIYSTLWGDADCGGAGSLETRPPWSYHWMAAGFLPALLPSIAIAVGLIAAMLQFLRRPTVVWAWPLAVFLAVGMLVIGLTLKVPYYSSAKAFYGFAAAAPLCILAAWGLALIGGKRPWLQDVILALVCVWAANAYLSYWILPDGLEAQVLKCQLLLERKQTAEAQSVLDRLLDRNEPLDTPSRLLLVNLCLRMGDLDLTYRWLELPPGEEDSAARHLLRGAVLEADQRPDEAIEEFHMAAELDPDYRDPAQRICRRAVSQGFQNPAAAVDACRNLLRIDPYQAETHAMLAQLYWRIGDEDSAERHEKYGSLLAPKRE